MRTKQIWCLSAPRKKMTMTTTYIAQNRGGGGEGVITETLLLNHALFLPLFLPFFFFTQLLLPPFPLISDRLETEAR